MRRFIDKTYHTLVKKDDVYKLYDLYNESQYWSLDKQKEYQLTLLQQLWNHTINNVPHYREFAKKTNLKSITSLEELKQIPIIDKSIFRSDINKFKANNISKERFIQNSTSGSSGSNFFFFKDAKQIECSSALTYRRYDWMGVSPFDKELIIWGTSWNAKKKRKHAELKKWIENKQLISGYNLSDQDIIEIHKHLVNGKYKIIKSYPSILNTVIDVFEKYNLSYQPAVIHIGGEKLYGFQKEKIEGFFNTKVFDFYGARDMTNIAQSCSHNEGLHIFMENVIVEVVDDEGNPIEEGEGDLVITNLHNYAMPFIRYKIGDRAKISQYKECSCGRTLPLLDEVLGRTFELITFPNGNRVMGTFWTLLFRSVKGIKDFQVVQEASGEIIIHYTITSDFKKDTLGFLLNKIHEYGGSKVKVAFLKKDKIKRNKAGKMSFVTSKFKQL